MIEYLVDEKQFGNIVSNGQAFAIIPVDDEIKVGETIHLIEVESVNPIEISPSKPIHIPGRTGRICTARVSHVCKLHEGLTPGYMLLSFFSGTFMTLEPKEKTEHGVCPSSKKLLKETSDYIM